MLFSAVSYDTLTEKGGDNHVQTQNDKKDERAAVAKNKPNNENVTISNHKVKLREWEPAGKQSKPLHV